MYSIVNMHIFLQMRKNLWKGLHRLCLTFKQLQVDWYELSISCPGDENKFSFTSNSSFRKNISLFPENNPRLPRVIEVKIICSISRILTTIKMGQQKGIIRKCVCV